VTTAPARWRALGDSVAVLGCVGAGRESGGGGKGEKEKEGRGEHGVEQRKMELGEALLDGGHGWLYSRGRSVHRRFLPTAMAGPLSRTSAAGGGEGVGGGNSRRDSAAVKWTSSSPASAVGAGPTYR